MWWCQIINRLNFETRPISLRNFGMTYTYGHDAEHSNKDSPTRLWTTLATATKTNQGVTKCARVCFILKVGFSIKDKHETER